MPQEAVIADFSGGMNASAGMDKLAENECLLAENVRFDEQGNVIITGANTLQNTSSLAGTVRSVFIDPVLGAIAGAGTNVYFGTAFSGMLSTSTVTNTNSGKMSFGPAPNRVYMDLGSVGYFKDPTIADLVTVDWEPPAGAQGGGGAGIATPPGTGSGWTSGNNITSTSTNSYATTVIGTAGGTSAAEKATNFGFSLNTSSAMLGIKVSFALKFDDTGVVPTISVQLVSAGAPIGTAKTFDTGGSAGLQTYTFGNATDLWGTVGLTAAACNDSSFGFQVRVSCQNNDVSTKFYVNSGFLTPYQITGSGFQVSSATAPVSNGANLGTGPYSWKMTWVAVGGEESQASPPSGTLTFTASGKAGTFTGVPTGDLRTISRNFYRKGGSLSSYYLIGSIPDNVSTTFGDGLSDLDALTTGIILAGDTVGDEPNTRLGTQQVKYPTYHYDRVFWASGDTLIWSKPLNGFAYPADFSTPVGDSKNITGIFSMGGQLFILKPDSIWQLTGSDENSFLLSKTLFTGRILFANSRGIWAFNGYTSNKITPKLDAWFRQNDHTGISVFGTTGFHVPEIVNPAATVLNSAAANPLFYYLSYAESGQTVPNAMLALDLERGAISKRSFAAQSLVADPVEGYIYGGNASGSILKLDDWGAANNGLGAAVNVDFQDRYRDLGLRGSRFSLEGLEFLLTTTGETVLVTVYFDEGQANETLGAISTPTHSTAKVYRKVQSAASRFCRNFSIRLNYQGKLVNSTNIPNIQLVHIKAYFDPRGARARTGEAP